MKRVIVPACCHLRCERGAGWRVAFAALLAAALVVSLARGQPPIADAFLPLPAGGTATSVSLAELEQLALANNPTLAMASANVRAARGRQIQGGLRPNPTIGYIADDIGEDDTAGKHGGFVSQEFVTGGKLRLNRAIGSREVARTSAAVRRAAAARAERRSLAVLRCARGAAASRVERRNCRDSSERSADQSQQLFNAGQISESDLLQVADRGPGIANPGGKRENQHAEARRRLAAVVGVDELDLSSLSGNLEDDIPSYSWDESYARVLSQNPRLAAAQMRSERARLALERARRENVPNVEVMASVSHMDQTGDDVAGVQVGIPLPICNRNQGNILTAEAELIAAQNDSRRIELELQDQLAMAYRALRRRPAAGEALSRRNPAACAEIVGLCRSRDSVGAGRLTGAADQPANVCSGQSDVCRGVGRAAPAVTLIEGMLLSDSLQEE